jgi:hypothetical protein
MVDFETDALWLQWQARALLLRGQPACLRLDQWQACIGGPVDHLASFVEGPIDHFENPDSEGPSYTPRDENGVALCGPYAGQDFSGGWFAYWLPSDDGLIPAVTGVELLEWLQTMTRGEKLPQPSAWLAPAGAEHATL